MISLLCGIENKQTNPKLTGKKRRVVTRRWGCGWAKWVKELKDTDF